MGELKETLDKKKEQSNRVKNDNSKEGKERD